MEPPKPRRPLAFVQPCPMGVTPLEYGQNLTTTDGRHGSRTRCVGRYSHGKRGGWRGRQEDAPVLFVRRHRQHRLAHAESRNGQTYFLLRRFAASSVALYRGVMDRDGGSMASLHCFLSGGAFLPLFFLRSPFAFCGCKNIKYTIGSDFLLPSVQKWKYIEYIVVLFISIQLFNY